MKSYKPIHQSLVVNYSVASIYLPDSYNNVIDVQHKIEISTWQVLPRSTFVDMERIVFACYLVF